MVKILKILYVCGHGQQVFSNINGECIRPQVSKVWTRRPAAHTLYPRDLPYTSTHTCAKRLSYSVRHQ